MFLSLNTMESPNLSPCTCSGPFSTSSRSIWVLSEEHILTCTLKQHCLWPFASEFLVKSSPFASACRDLSTVPKPSPWSGFGNMPVVASFTLFSQFQVLTTNLPSGQATLLGLSKSHQVGPGIAKLLFKAGEV